MKLRDSIAFVMAVRSGDRVALRAIPQRGLQAACLALSALLALGAAMQFKPPGSDERLAAIGLTAELSQTLRRALTPEDAFAPISKPGPSDWLANHREAGQTFEEFTRSRPNRPDKDRRKLYLQPLGEFSKNRGPPLDSLQKFAAAFFMLDVEVLPALNLAESRITSRQNRHTDQKQLLTGDILKLLKRNLPNDAFAVLGITMIDLYPDESWNFVFGQASLRDRVGVYSFARYNPRESGRERPEDWQRVMLRRSGKVLAREMAHMFGIRHCVYFNCLMNGSNHLAESDARPPHLCPVDLRKLHHAIGFDVVERYRRLHDFTEEAGFVDEARWLEKRLKHITQGRRRP